MASRAAPCSVPTSGGALVQEPFERSASNVIRSRTALGGHRLRQVRLGHAVAFMSSARQVDPAVAEILDHVLAVLDELQSSADVIGGRDALRGRRAHDVQDHLADRVGRQLAVPPRSA